MSCSFLLSSGSHNASPALAYLFPDFFCLCCFTSCCLTDVECVCFNCYSFIYNGDYTWNSLEKWLWGGGGAEGQGEQKAVQHLLNAGELGWETCCQWIPVWAHWRAVQGSGQPSLILTAWWPALEGEAPPRQSPSLCLGLGSALGPTTCLRTLVPNPPMRFSQQRALLKNKKSLL